MDSGGRRYTNKVDIWAMGCILYELATGTHAFEDDWQVCQYRYSGTDKVIVLSEAKFDGHSNEALTKNIVDMLKLESSARPSASVLSEEFTRQHRLAQNRYLPVVGRSLYFAARWGNLEEVKMALAKGADVNFTHDTEDNNPLQAALESQKWDVARFLLDKGADVNMQGGRFGNALQAAAFHGNEELVRLLLEKRANVNAQGGEYANALQAASYSGHDVVVRLLLFTGADVNAQGGYYGNALQAASSRGFELLVRLLLQKGADVNSHGGYYGNALQAASSRGFELVVRLLLENGADVNAQGGFYGNALIAASRKSHKTVAQMLLDNGAKWSLKDGR
jgi:ankyrin repeat protein